MTGKKHAEQTQFIADLQSRNIESVQPQIDSVQKCYKECSHCSEAELKEKTEELWKQLNSLLSPFFDQALGGISEKERNRIHKRIRNRLEKHIELIRSQENDFLVQNNGKEGSPPFFAFIAWNTIYKDEIRRKKNTLKIEDLYQQCLNEDEEHYGGCLYELLEALKAQLSRLLWVTMINVSDSKVIDVDGVQNEVDEEIVEKIRSYRQSADSSPETFMGIAISIYIRKAVNFNRRKSRKRKNAASGSGRSGYDQPFIISLNHFEWDDENDRSREIPLPDPNKTSTGWGYYEERERSEYRQIIIEGLCRLLTTKCAEKHHPLHLLATFYCRIRAELAGSTSTGRWALQTMARKDGWQLAAESEEWMKKNISEDLSWSSAFYIKLDKINNNSNKKNGDTIISETYDLQWVLNNSRNVVKSLTEMIANDEDLTAWNDAYL